MCQVPCAVRASTWLAPSPISSGCQPPLPTFAAERARIATRMREDQSKGECERQGDVGCTSGRERNQHRQPSAIPRAGRHEEHQANAPRPEPLRSPPFPDGQHGYALVAAVAALLPFAGPAIGLARFTRARQSEVASEIAHARATTTAQAGLAIAVQGQVARDAASLAALDGRTRPPAVRTKAASEPIPVSWREHEVAPSTSRATTPSLTSPKPCGQAHSRYRTQ